MHRPFEQLLSRLTQIMVIGTIAFTACWAAEADGGWVNAGIGKPTVPGKHTIVGGKLTITGGGLGLDRQGADQCQFVFQRRIAGDFQVVAQLASLTGGDDAIAGILVRPQDGAANGPMAAVYLQVKDNRIEWKSRIPGASQPAPATVHSGSGKLAQPAPLWLKLIRMGKNFAVYKSRDGKFWSMISNVSGGPVAFDGALDVGFFVVNSAADKTATATFGNIAIGAASMPYKTGWVGNTFGSRNEDSHVSNGLSAMWVASDGTCYTSAYWDEGGHAVKAYRDGKVVRALPIGTPQTYEGAITGEGKYVYVAAVDNIIQCDTTATDFAPRTLMLSVNLIDKEKNHSVVTGMAADADTLFVADSRENRIRVVSLKNQTYHVATASNDGTANAPGVVQLPKNETRLAPALVYQSQRVGEGFKYTIPGGVPNATYLVRCHLAEYVGRSADCDPRNRRVRIGEAELNVGEMAGGVLKAVVHDVPGVKADDKGQISIDINSYGGPGLCGFEIIGEGGKRIFAVNCGGPPVGDFKGESPELVDRSFACERPGGMVIDKRGDIWVIQRGNDHPIGHGVTAKYKAAVRCYQRDGKPTGRMISDVVNPRGLAYDAAKDQLLVAENGTDLNIRIYGALGTAPVLSKTFGEKSGIYAGKNPGLVNDPQAGGRARFAGVAGVGVDAKGRIYVGGGFQGTDLRQFRADGSFGWMINSLTFCNTYAVDPDSDGSDIYSTYTHLRLDLAQKNPGSEQTYLAYNWDHRRFPEAPGAGGSQAMMGRLGAERRLVMVTSGQGQIGELNIFRYDGHLAIPAGGTRNGGSRFWIDANGDGLMTEEECSSMESALSWITSICLDSKGDLWASMSGTGGSFMRHFRFKGFNAHQVPIYGTIKGEDYEDVGYPEEGSSTNAWSMASRMDYDAERDLMVAFYPLVARNGEADKSPVQYALACYDRWSTGNRKPLWKFKAFTPQTDPDYFMYERDLFPYAGYMGMHLAGDYVFIAYLYGEIHAFDLKTGKLAQTFPHGPEVNGQCAWEDATMGLRAFKRKDGEYLIFTENSGWGGKNNFFRWRPSVTP